MTATLFIVATPIGNLADMSFRAVEVLKSVDIIAAEDTRHSAKLLQHYHISTPCIPYHDHSDENQTRRIIEKLREDLSVALISDAGTPLISDPGYKLVLAAREAGFTVQPVPGACALIAALSAAGLPTDRFAFYGFPPAKTAARKAFFEELSAFSHSLVFYESPHRVQESLLAMREVFGGQRRAVLAREISKTFETFLSGDLQTLCEALESDANQSRGEFVLMLEGASEQASEAFSAETLRILTALLEELSVKQAASLAAKITGEKKNKLYKWALELQAE